MCSSDNYLSAFQLLLLVSFQQRNLLLKCLNSGSYLNRFWNRQHCAWNKERFGEFYITEDTTQLISIANSIQWSTLNFQPWKRIEMSTLYANRYFEIQNTKSTFQVNKRYPTERSFNISFHPVELNSTSNYRFSESVSFPLQREYLWTDLRVAQIATCCWAFFTTTASC